MRSRRAESQSGETPPQTGASSPASAVHSVPLIVFFFVVAELQIGAFELRRRRIRFRSLSAFKLRQNLAQRHNQFIPRNMAPLELNPELERFILRLKVKNKRLRPLRPALFFFAFPPRFIPRQSTLQDAMQHLRHFLFGGL